MIAIHAVATAPSSLPEVPARLTAFDVKPTTLDGKRDELRYNWKHPLFVRAVAEACSERTGGAS